MLGWVKCWKDRDEKLTPENLLLQQAAVAGHAQPLTVLINPGIGKPPDVLVRLGAVGALRVINPNHHCRGRIHLHFHVIDTHSAGLKLGIGKIRKKLPAIAHFPIPLGVRELVADHAGDGSSIAHDLGLVPHALKSNQLGCFRIRNRLWGLRVSAQCNQKKAAHYSYAGPSVPPQCSRFFGHILRQDIVGASLIAIENIVETLPMSQKPASRHCHFYQLALQTNFP